MKMKLAVQSDIKLDDVIAKALDIERHCNDMVFPGAYIGRGKNQQPTMVQYPGLTNTHAVNDGNYGTLNFLAPIAKAGNNMVSLPVSAKLTPWAFYQLCSCRLHVPYTYMKQCIDSNYPDVRALFEQNVNTLLSHYDKGVRIRLYQPDPNGPIQVRGIVTDSYAVFDSDAVLTTTKAVLGDNFNIKGYWLDEEGLHLRVVTPEPLEVKGEDLYPGFIISSGDVGNRKLTVQYFLWKQVCTNGLVISRLNGSVLKKRHRGSYDHNEFVAALTDSLEGFPVFCQNASTLVEETRTKKLTSDGLQKRLKQFADEFKLDSDERHEVVELTKQNYGMTLWGFVNALTEFAQADRFDIDKRTEIETYAGNLMAFKAA